MKSRKTKYHYIAAITCAMCIQPTPQSLAAEKNFPEIDSLLASRIDSTQIAEIENITLIRDVGQFTLKKGTLSLIYTAHRRLIGAYFAGQGTFQFRPSTFVEREYLKKQISTENLHEDFSKAVFLFSDSTLQELKKQTTFRAGTIQNGAQEFMMSFLSKQVGNAEANAEYNKNYVLSYLNDTYSRYFQAVVETKKRKYYFEFDPFTNEEVKLYSDEVVGGNTYHYILSNFHKLEDIEKGTPSDENNSFYDITHYDISAKINDELLMIAKAKIAINSTSDDLRWLPFKLDPSFRIAKVQWKSSPKVDYAVYDDGFFVNSSDEVRAGNIDTLIVEYYGKYFKKHASNFMFMGSSSGWYPKKSETFQATFLTRFTVPSKFVFGCGGELIEEKRTEDTYYSAWKIDKPTIHNTIALGDYQETKSSTNDSIAKTQVYSFKVNSANGAETSYGDLSLSFRTSNPEYVLTNVTESLKFYTKIFGKPSFDSMRVYEIPYSHGQAFPGLTHLTYYGFSNITGIDKGSNEQLVAHEMAHQWWGTDIGWKSYHDQWMSEAFAEFSSMLYVQLALKSNDIYFQDLKKKREHILGIFHSGRPFGPTWLGVRSASIGNSKQYFTMIYEKGAWVMHMLRNMMLDLKTLKEDRFIDMMKDFHMSYKGKIASTEDFIGTVNKHFGKNMTWFFKQWIYSTDIPTYKFTYTTEKTEQGKYKVHCVVEQKNVPEDFGMEIPLKVDFGKDRYYRLRVGVVGQKSEFDLPLLPEEPKNIIFNDLQSVLCEMD